MSTRMKSGQTGASLVEIMITMLIGLVIVGGLAQMFVAGKASYSLQDRLGSLQENGRYALFFLQRDIRNAGMPRDGGIIAFVQGAGQTADGGGNASDSISVRHRAMVAGTTDCQGNNIPVGTQVVTTYSINVDAATGVSRLMCAAQGQPAQPIVDGIENMQILYGVDLDADDQPGYGYADYYVPATGVTAAQWASRVVAVRISVLACTLTPISGDRPEDNNTRTYVMLNAPPVNAIIRPFPFPNGPNTPLRARVFTTTIEVRNRTV